MAPTILIAVLIFTFTSYPIHSLWPHLVSSFISLLSTHLSPYPSPYESDKLPYPLPASGTSTAKSKSETAFLLSVWDLLWQKPQNAKRYVCSNSCKPTMSRQSHPPGRSSGCTDHVWCSQSSGTTLSPAWGDQGLQRFPLWGSFYYKDTKRHLWYKRTLLPNNMFSQA